MPDTSVRPRRVLPVLLGAAVAGILAGAVAVYVMVSGERNGDVASAECEAAVAAAGRAAPFAKGEVAAFRIASAPRSLADLAFTGPEGKPVTLHSLGGKAALVNIWATWCVPCREEMPALDKLETRLGGNDFQVVAVNIDKGGPEKPAAFLKETGVTHLAIYTDPSGKLFATLKAVGMPSTLIVDRNGREIARLVGPADWASPEAVKVIEAAIAAPSASASP
jgi:thiol-disulfide isomerase/thioredoxin